jgi:DNA-directed RNA polymerase specialized sigma24 family protein
MRHADFERLYAEHSAPLLAFLVYRVGERAAAEDLLADTFERVLTARRGFDRRKGARRPGCIRSR